jgi:Zn-dependent M28 family amino/carboxypeptidase
MPGQSHKGPLPLPTAEQLQVRERLRTHVEALAEKIGPRHMGRPEALEAAAQYIEAALRDAGYEVAAQECRVWGRSVRNLEAELAGDSAPEEIVIIGAHYDSVPGSPGADDNATGVAGVLEVARLLRGRRLPRTVRFVAFVNEEPPFFLTDRMGSRSYARRCRERQEHIAAVLVLETIGYYSEAEKSQQYPFPFNLFHPSTGNFIAFVGNLSSRHLVRQAVAGFRRHAAFPSEGGAVPAWVEGANWSDHWSFWQEGYPAVMATDTAPFRYPHYHTPEDTADKVDFDRTARVITGIAQVVADLAGEPPG